MWINTYIVIDTFYLDYELEIEANWLKDGTNWEKDQNQDIERDQVVEHMLVGRKWIQQALVVEKRVYKYKKYQLFQILNDGTYLQIKIQNTHLLFWIFDHFIFYVNLIYKCIMIIRVKKAKKML